MSCYLQFGLRFPRGPLLRLLRTGVCATALSTVAACPAVWATQAPTQHAPSEIVAHIEGSDVSIDGKMIENASTLESVANGNAITVHSGDAVLRLVDGGEISICGPAKLMVLKSDATVTLALQFGRMHFDLPAAAKVRVLTPSIVATPTDIAGGKRDLIVGLDQDNSMCVIAATGAVQLEQQFSGERLIVPESGDFSLQGGQLAPMADTGQSCKCVSMLLSPEVSEPEVAMAAGTNQSHPIASAKDRSADAPPVFTPGSTAVLPSLIFSSPNPQAPNAPTAETAMLVREVRAESDWEFSGSVQTPDFARASRALGVSGNRTASDESSSRKKSGGFWASLKRFFVG